MALTYDDLTAGTQKHIVPGLVDTVYKVDPILPMLRKNNAEKFEGGLKVTQPIMYAKLKGGAFTRGGTFDTSYVQTDTAKLNKRRCLVIKGDARQCSTGNPWQAFVV